jgi:Family of unknown function (DUF5682)
VTAQSHILGVRHHGPGSARAVVAALEAMRPDAVLVEGPQDADALVGLAADPAMTPPVALLAYATDEPSRAVFWPFAVFSPEWQAIRWAARNGAAVRFCDLPAAAVLADGDGPADGAPADAEPADAGRAADDPDGLRGDPIALLAGAAGYDDPERWWDDVVESRVDGPDPFEAIGEAMAELRADAPPLPERERLREERREAHMRTVLRRTLADGYERVAVVCGAWHVPALSGTLPPARSDAAVLKGLPKRRVSVTWVPWTHSRLAAASGYGAGVTSPGWYHHLFTAPGRTVARWMTAVAGVLRAEDLPVSSAHVIEAVRLAETLAVLRGRPLAGLAEVTEATRAVLCDGDDVLLDLVTSRLVVGEALGAVPDSTPTVPLAADLTAQARRLRLVQEPARRVVELDLRRPLGLDRSRLLHRLRLLGVHWGYQGGSTTRSTGTFRETWTLCWRPEFAVAVVEASVWGTTVADAAAARLVDTAGRGSLAELTLAVESCLLADLPAVLPELLSVLDARAALDVDVAHLADALPALVRALRYGDVRGTDTSALVRVTDALLVRIRAGLPAALSGLDDDAARAMCGRIDAVHAAVELRDDPEVRDRWLATLAGLADRPDLHGLVAGRLVRLLRDAGRFGHADTAARLDRALSVGSPPAAKAAWVEGFLTGGGMLLVHDAELLALLDEWVCRLGETEFVDLLPLLRRTFGSFAGGERRTVAEQVRRGPRAAGAGGDDTVDEARGAAALPVAAMLLGVGR